MVMNMKRICIVIINYKTPLMTLDCIGTLIDQLDHKMDAIVIVDNKSGGDDVPIMQNGINQMGLSDWVTIVQSDENRGFSAGNNIGIKAVKAEYYLLANSDTLFRPNAIAGLLKAAKAYPNAGILSPRLEWRDGDPQISCFRYHTPPFEMIKTAGTDIITKVLNRFNVPLNIEDKMSMPEWTSFACVLIKGEVFDKIGYLDEGYFMFFEDVDYCRRAKKAGYELVNWPHSHVVHLRGQSSNVKKKEQKKKRLPAYYYRSRARYYKKFFGNTGFLLSNLFWFAGRSISMLKEIFLGRERAVPEFQWVDIWKK